MVYDGLGSVASVRKIGGQISDIEMTDTEIEEYLEAATAYVEEGTGISRVDWPSRSEFGMATTATNNHAAAYCVLVVSTHKDPTARMKELLMAADVLIERIRTGASVVEGEEDPFFINETSDYRTYENNPLGVAPYMSTR